jgi:prepilin-type processing-associated H-X9-DG protein
MNYIGISGAVADSGFADSRQNICCVQGEHDGIISGGGTFLPHEDVKLSGISDGTSNVVMVGECSDYVQDSVGENHRLTQYPISIGGMTDVYGIVGSGNSRYGNAWCLTTIRYPINSNNSELPGVGLEGINNGIYSAHPGGVNVAVADGSVHFLTETTDLLLLKRLVTRDDGAVTNLD